MIFNLFFFYNFYVTITRWRFSKIMNNIKKTSILTSIFLTVILLFTGIILSMIISLLLSRFSIKLLKISSLNSLFLSSGILLNFYADGKLQKKINSIILLFLSFTIVTGISIVGFIFLFMIEPLFFFYRTNIVFTYLFVNFIFIIVLIILSNGYLLFQDKIYHAKNLLAEETALRKEIEENLMLSKINPHFLYNSLNLILALLEDKKKAENAIISLSDILRYSSDSDIYKYVDISREVDAVKKYLWLQKMRFSDRLDYDIDCSFEAKIQPMILQPLVENSVKHNINNTDKLFLSLHFFKIDNLIKIDIFDSERKINESDIGKGKGLSITKRRLELINGSLSIVNGGISITYDSSNCR